MKAKWCGLVVLLTCGMAMGQDAEKKFAPKDVETKPAKKSELELALEDALKNNPDLRVAVAKAAEAEAQLIRSRAQVVQKVVAAWQAVRGAMALKEEHERRLAHMSKQRAKMKGSVADDDFFGTQASVAKAKAALAAAEAELEYLTGRGKEAVRAREFLATHYRRLRALDLDSRIERAWEVETAKIETKGPVPDKLRARLVRRVSIRHKDKPASALLDQIKFLLPGVRIVHVEASKSEKEKAITVELEAVSIATVMQVLEDSLGNYQFVFRDYGLLLAPRDKLPADALTLSAYLKTLPKETPKFVGKVERIDKEDIHLSIGSDAGVIKGDLLVVYRPGDKPTTLAPVKVVEVNGKTSVARVWGGKAKEAIKVGDEVSDQSPELK